MAEQKIKYSEIFHSFQGEGTFTGRSTAWIRYFLCNLQCDGFGQEDPTDPSTYILPYKTFDISSIEKIEDLPVWSYGCDSSYTWAKKYKHLAHVENASVICDNIQNVLKSESNPNGLFRHPKTHQNHHMAFTGGEPMLKSNQLGTTNILKEFTTRGNFPQMCTVETNGTQHISEALLEILLQNQYLRNDKFEWFWSVSPKLWSTAGEKPSKAINPEVVGQYAQVSNHGHLKYVVDGTKDSWAEVEQYTKQFRDAGVHWDVYIMPVGATKEDQETPKIAEIAIEAMKRGYHVSGRLHCYVFGNQIGT